MADRQRYEYFCDIVETARFDVLHSNLGAMGRKGWRLAHVVPHRWNAADPGDLLLVWERPIQATGDRRRATGEEGPDG